MKTFTMILFLSLVLSMVLLTACSKPKAEEITADVTTLAQDLLIHLNQIDTAMTAGIGARQGKFGSEDDIRMLLSESLKAHPAIVTACYVDTKGILKYLEPQKYKDSEGADISKQAHTMAMLENPSPIMSTAFSAVEGVAVIVLAQPLYDAKNIFVGSLALTIDTSVLPQLVLDENKLSKDFELWAMETDGMMVLNQDKEEIGLNLFTDELYQPHESLRVLGKKIAAETKGDGEYRFMATGTDQVVDKKATWDTISMHGRDWRVVLIQVKK